MCFSCAIRAGAEALEGEEYGGEFEGVDDRRGSVGRRNETIGGLRHNFDGVAGAPRELRLHRGAHEEFGQEAAPAAAAI